MKNKIALFFLVVSLSTVVDSILAGNNIPSNNKNNISSGIGSNKIPPAKTTEAEAEPKGKVERYFPLIVFGGLVVLIIRSYLKENAGPSYSGGNKSKYK